MNNNKVLSFYSRTNSHPRQTAEDLIRISEHLAEQEKRCVAAMQTANSLLFSGSADKNMAASINRLKKELDVGPLVLAQMTTNLLLLRSHNSLS